MTGVLRARLLLSLLTGLLLAAGWLGGAHLFACGSSADDSASAAITSHAKLERTQSPAAPLPGAADASDRLSGTQDSPDDEELADLSAGALGRVQRVLQRTPGSIQLEPEHAPSTGLDRPPRA